MSAIIGFLTSLNWASPSWDIFILLFFVVGSLLYGLSLGRDRVLVILMSVYVALAVVTNSPPLESFQLSVNVSENAVMKITIFLGIFVVLFFLLARSGLLKTFGRSGAPGSWWQTIVFSVLQVGLLISVTLNFLPHDMTAGLTETTKQIFMSENGRTAWLILPVLVMVIVPKQKESAPGA